jgi:hypothetical protein
LQRKRTVYGAAARLVGAVIALLYLQACASVSVTEQRDNLIGGPSRPPDAILVQPFQVDPAVLRVDREGQELRSFQRDLSGTLTLQLLRRLPRHVAPARILPAGEAPPRGDMWLVTGSFERVNQGSRFLRSTVGFGAGGTKMETSVRVFDLSGPYPKEFISFKTTGGSNFSQGLVGLLTIPFQGPVGWTSLANTMQGFFSGVSFDARRTSKEITAVISEYMHRKRITPSGLKVLKPKRLGEVPDLLPDGEP